VLVCPPAAESWYSVAPAHNIHMQDPSPEQATQCMDTEVTSMCKICMPVADVQNRCWDLGWCKAFVLDTKDNCSYLKTGPGDALLRDPQFVTYCVYNQKGCRGGGGEPGVPPACLGLISGPVSHDLINAALARYRGPWSGTSPVGGEDATLQHCWQQQQQQQQREYQ
jgi:hypothetical protein